MPLLTDTAIRNVKPRAKPYRLYDIGGLYLEVSTAGLSASAHASRYLSGPGRLSRPTPFPQKGRAKPLDVPVRTFVGFSRAPRPSPHWPARNVRELARSLPIDPL
jgi:hypothetical protein